MPDVERIADKPGPDHHPVREKTSVKESILPGTYHEHGAHDRKKRLVSGEFPAVQHRNCYENEPHPHSREHVLTESYAVLL